jgi:hypothetical protein
MGPCRQAVEGQQARRPARLTRLSGTRRRAADYHSRASPRPRRISTARIAVLNPIA